MTKYILLFQICSLLSQQCYPPMTDGEPIDSWSECVEKGAIKVIELIQTDRETWDKNKFVVKYWCNEDNSNKTPTSRKQFEKEI